MKRWTFLQSIRINVPAKRLTGLLLAGVMAASLMACGKAEEEKEERVTLHILSMRGVGEFPEGTDENNNPWVDYLKEKTGYDFEFTFYNQQNAEDRNLLASSGLTYDLISWPSDATADMVKLYSSGYLTAIDEYESVAPDAFGQVPEDVWRTVRQDGATIALPSVSTTTGNTGMGIRADYLEKVGKEMPETFEEFKDVLIAFRDGDPDGNGVNDTIPLGGAIPFQQTIEMFLDTAGMPDPDLLIRTSGEIRLSNYLLWQCAYTEIYVTDCLWPDFDQEELEKAVAAYNRRERRFGGVK